MYHASELGQVNNPKLGSEIQALLDKESLTESDRVYINSFFLYYNKHGHLTSKQYNFFKSIENKYSDENIESAKEWIKNYNDEKRNRFNLAVEYYYLTPYYREIVRRGKTDPRFIPSEKQYNAMCNNKYFQRALEYYNTPAKYEIGDLVQFRRAYDNTDICMIEHVSDKPTFTKGSRTYKIMILGEEDSTTVHEYDIKKYREPKNV